MLDKLAFHQQGCRRLRHNIRTRVLPPDSAKCNGHSYGVLCARHGPTARTPALASKGVAGYDSLRAHGCSRFSVRSAKATAVSCIAPGVDWLLARLHSRARVSQAAPRYARAGAPSLLMRRATATAVACGAPGLGRRLTRLRSRARMSQATTRYAHAGAPALLCGVQLPQLWRAVRQAYAGGSRACVHEHVCRELRRDMRTRVLPLCCADCDNHSYGLQRAGREPRTWHACLWSADRRELLDKPT